MQDYAATALEWYHQFVSHDGTRMSNNPNLNFRLYNIGIPGEVFGADDAFVIGNLLWDSSGQPWNPTQIMPADRSALALYDRLREPIRYAIKEITDPLESEFSLWYLIVDLIETHKLLGGLIKNANRIKSIMRSSKSYLAIFNKYSMREFSSSHLAVQYGMLPTIADIRDFADTVLKWYRTWITKTHKLGTLRTFKGRAIVLEEAKPDTVDRLRFPVSTVNNVYVNCIVSRGPVISHQTVKYYFICPELTDGMAALKAAVDQLGIFDPAALWDAIPFSFAIDWFLDVSKLLHSMKPHLFPITLVISDWGESLHTQSHAKLIMTYLGCTIEAYPETQGDDILCEVTVRQIARRRQFPYPLQIDPASLVGNGLTIRRIINGLAIIVGKSVRGHYPPKAANYRYRARKGVRALVKRL